MIPLLLFALGCGGDAADTDVPEEQTAEEKTVEEKTVEEKTVEEYVLSDEAYRFCHEPGLFADSVDEWCSLLEGVPEDVCPGMRETCNGADPVELSTGCNGSGGAGGAGSSPAGSPDRPSPRREPPSCELPESPVTGLIAIMRWVVALVVALMLLAVFRLVWGVLASRRVPGVEAAVLPEVEPEPEQVLEDVPDLPSTDLLAAAREALQKGDFGQAVLMARGAALRRLGDLGRIRLHRSRTDREYARAVRRDADLHAALREVLGAVETHRWGGAALDRERSESAVAAAEVILKTLLALLVLLAATPDAAAQEDRYGPSGDAALAELLSAWGHDAGFRLRGLDSLDEDVDVLVLDTTWVMPEDEGWDALRVWVEGGGVLVVGGFCPWTELGERMLVDHAAPAEGAPVLDELMLPTPRWPNGPYWAWKDYIGTPWVELYTPEGPLPPDAEPAGRAWAPIVVAHAGAGTIVAIADARLLWNGAYVDPDNERFMGDLLHAGQGAMGWGLDTPIRVELATTATASSPSPTQSILNADLLAFMVQLMITWVLLGLWRGWPFAPLADPPEEGRLAFADHVRALGTRWLRAGSSRYALAAYGGLWLQRLGPQGLKRAAVRAGRDPTRADALVLAVQAAVEDPEGVDSEHDLEWMEELWTITQNR